MADYITKISVDGVDRQIDYTALANKPVEVTEATVTGWGFVKTTYDDTEIKANVTDITNRLSAVENSINNATDLDAAQF